MNEHPFTATLKTRFGGLLRHGSHEPDGQACALEAVNVARGNEWSDNPASARMPDLRALNDARWSSDRERTDALVPVVLALWDWNEWGAERRVSWAKRVAERTIRELLPPVLRASGLNDEADRCEQDGTQNAADAAADAAAYAARAAAYAADAAARAAAYAADAAAYAAAYAAADAAAYAAYVAEPPKLICRIFVECAAETLPVAA